MSVFIVISVVYVTFFAALALGLWLNKRLESRRWRFLKK